LFDNLNDAWRPAIPGVSQHQLAALKLESAQTLAGSLTLYWCEIKLITL
jgi:hypothetical protein